MTPAFLLSVCVVCLVNLLICLCQFLIQVGQRLGILAQIRQSSVLIVTADSVVPPLPFLDSSPFLSVFSPAFVAESPRSDDVDSAPVRRQVILLNLYLRVLPRRLIRGCLCPVIVSHSCSRC